MLRACRHVAPKHGLGKGASRTAALFPCHCLGQEVARRGPLSLPHCIVAESKDAIWCLSHLTARNVTMGYPEGARPGSKSFRPPQANLAKKHFSGIQVTLRLRSAAFDSPTSFFQSPQKGCLGVFGWQGIPPGNLQGEPSKEENRKARRPSLGPLVGNSGFSGQNVSIIGAVDSEP